MKRALGFLTIGGILAASVIASRVFLRQSTFVYSVNIVGGGETINLPVTESGPHWSIGTSTNLYGYWQYTERPQYLSGKAFLHQAVWHRTYTSINLGRHYLIVPGPAWMALLASVIGVIVVISVTATAVRWICETDVEKAKTPLMIQISSHTEVCNSPRTR